MRRKKERSMYMYMFVCLVVLWLHVVLPVCAANVLNT